jgi:hypothetical protein
MAAEAPDSAVVEAAQAPQPGSDAVAAQLPPVAPAPDPAARRNSATTAAPPEGEVDGVAAPTEDAPRAADSGDQARAAAGSAPNGTAVAGPPRPEPAGLADLARGGDGAAAAAGSDGTPAGPTPDGTPAGRTPDGTPAGRTVDGPPTGRTPDGTPAGRTPDGGSAGGSTDGGAAVDPAGSAELADVAGLLALVGGEAAEPPAGGDREQFAAAAVLDVLRAAGWLDYAAATRLGAEVERLRELLDMVVRDHRAREATAADVENQQLHWLVPLLRAAHGVAFGTLGAKVALRSAMHEVPPHLLATAGVRIPDYDPESEVDG